MTLPPLADVLRLLASLAGVVGVAAGLLWGCGFLVARPLLPRRYRPVLPLVAPFLGFSLVSAVAHYAGAAGAPLRSGLWLFVGLAAAGWVVVFLDRRLRRFPRSSAPALVVCLLAFLLAVAPLLALGYLTTLGGTIDGISYAVRAEYLQEAPPELPDIEAGKPYLGWVRSQIELLRLGDTYLVGLLGLLTGRRSYELLTVVPALFFALMAGSVYVLARVALGLGRGAALLAAALVAVHNLLLWPVYDNFLSQSIGLSFLPVVLAFGIEAQRRPGWRMAAVFAILASGLASVYPMYAARMLAAVLLFWGLTWLFRPRGPRLRSLRRAVVWWGGALATAAVWNAVALTRSAGELGLLSGALTSGAAKNLGPGNILVFPVPEEVFGLIAHAAAAFGTDWLFVPLRVLIALGLACGGLAVYGWWRLSPRARLVTAALLLASAALVAQQRWVAEYPYGYFKIITTVVAEVMILVAAGIVAFWRGPHDSARSRVVRRRLATGAALLLLALNLKHSLWTQSYVLKNLVAVDRELIEMGRAASRVDADAWVVLDMNASVRQHWLGYLIRDRKIRFREPLWMGDVDTPGAANAYFRYAMVEKSLDAQRRSAALDEPWYDPSAYDRLASNGRYELRERRDTMLGSVRWDRRWPEQAALELALPSPGTFSARLGTEAKDAGVGSGRPRTVQVRVYGLSPSNRLEGAALGSPLTLGPGGWLLDFDLRCVSGGQIGITRGAGDVVLSDVRVLGTVTGRPGVCLERAALPTGLAYLEQENPGDGRIRLRAAVLRPQGTGAHHYRLGLHVVEVSLGKLFGVWSLDFPTDERVQHGSLEIDLRNRSSRGEIDGRPVEVATSSFDHEAGSFEADAVWWQFDPLAQLGIEPMLWFERDGQGAVRVNRDAPGARIEVLSAP